VVLFPTASSATTATTAAFRCGRLCGAQRSETTHDLVHNAAYTVFVQNLTAHCLAFHLSKDFAPRDVPFRSFRSLYKPSCPVHRLYRPDRPQPHPQADLSFLRPVGRNSPDKTSPSRRHRPP